MITNGDEMKKLLAILASSLLATAYAADVQNPSSVLSASGGRYVFGQISQYRRDQYMLDTQTGRLWVSVCLKGGDQVTGCEVLALQPIAYQNDSFDGYSVLPPLATFKKQQIDHEIS